MTLTDHLCGKKCAAIAAERAKGGATPVWNSLSHEEQKAWLVQQHSWDVLRPIHRAIFVAKALFGRVD